MRNEQVERSLAGLRFGRRVFQHEDPGSTNDLALAEIAAGRARDGDVHVADRQTRGRGTGERSWHSPAGAGLYASLVVTGEVAARPLPFLPALALADLLAADHALAAHLKWPNDVLVGERKIAGILVEGRGGGAGGSAYVIGVGLNLGQISFPPELAERATSIRIECGTGPDRDATLVALLARMSRMDAAGLDLVPAFRARCRMIGRTLENAAGERLAVLDLSAEGHLLVRDHAGRERRLLSRSESEFLPGWLRGAPPFTPPPPLV